MDKRDDEQDAKQDVEMGEELMSVLPKDLKSSLANIRRIAEGNTVKNKDGMTVVTKDDQWRKEPDWESSIRRYKDK